MSANEARCHLDVEDHYQHQACPVSLFLEAASVELEEDDVSILHHIVAASLVVLAGSLKNRGTAASETKKVCLRGVCKQPLWD